jgi:hypothetical protein
MCNASGFQSVSELELESSLLFPLPWASHYRCVLSLAMLWRVARRCERGRNTVEDLLPTTTIQGYVDECGNGYSLCWPQSGFMVQA